MFTLLTASETYCTIFVSDWHKVFFITLFFQLLVCLPLWYAYKNIYKLTGSAWQLGIIATVPIVIGDILGTYVGSFFRELPSKWQTVAIGINLIAVFVSRIK